MLSKQHRLAKSTEIQTVNKRGRRFFTQRLVLKYLARPTGPARFNFIVSTKVSKKAVDRNFIKRKLREVVRPNIKTLTAGDYSVIVKPHKIEKASTLFEEFAGLIKKIK